MDRVGAEHPIFSLSSPTINKVLGSRWIFCWIYGIYGALGDTYTSCMAKKIKVHEPKLLLLLVVLVVLVQTSKAGRPFFIRLPGRFGKREIVGMAIRTQDSGLRTQR